MKTKNIISVALSCALVATTMTGCASNSNSDTSKTTTNTASASTVSNLSDMSVEFEKNYAYGDFNDHSHKDTTRQDGIDTFADNDIVFQDITYGQLMDLMGKEGNWMIQLSGSWCHNSRAMSPVVNKYAKEYGIDTIYSYDFNINNGDDGSFFVRMSNEKTTPGTKLNYMYGEMVSRYLKNLDDWVEYPSTHSTALTYTNALGQETTVGRLQQPIVLVYNKDNRVDYSGKNNGSTECPIMYAFEEMVDRDSKGAYKNKTDDDGEYVLDDDGNKIREYCTDEFDSHVKKMFDFIKENNLVMSHYTKADYIRDSFNSYGNIFSTDEQINIYPVTYRQLLWIMKQQGNSVIMIGGPGSEQTRATIKRVNDTAFSKNVRVFLYDPRVENAITTDKWGYKQDTNILDEDTVAASMYTDLIENGLTNLEVTHKLSTGEPLIQEPFLFVYNKAALDEDGFAAPIRAWAELLYNNDTNSRYFIGKESNQKACDKKIAKVFETYNTIDTCCGE